MVVTNYPIKKSLSKLDLSGRLTKCSIELRIYEIKYISRTTKKSQVIANFLVEIQSLYPMDKELIVLLEEGMRWVLNLDRASNKEEAGIKVMLESSGVIIE